MSNEELIKNLEKYDKEVNKLFQENKSLKKIISEMEIFLEEHEATYTLRKLKDLEEKYKIGSEINA
jgi:hypothetical protein